MHADGCARLSSGWRAGTWPTRRPRCRRGRAHLNTDDGERGAVRAVRGARVMRRTVVLSRLATSAQRPTSAGGTSNLTRAHTSTHELATEELICNNAEACRHRDTKADVLSPDAQQTGLNKRHTHPHPPTQRPEEAAWTSPQRTTPHLLPPARALPHPRRRCQLFRGIAHLPARARGFATRTTVHTNGWQPRCVGWLPLRDRAPAPHALIFKSASARQDIPPEKSSPSEPARATARSSMSSRTCGTPLTSCVRARPPSGHKTRKVERLHRDIERIRLQLRWCRRSGCPYGGRGNAAIARCCRPRHRLHSDQQCLFDAIAHADVSQRDGPLVN